MIIVLLAWLVVGEILHRLANRDGYTWGYYSGSGWLCRVMVVVQAPAVWIGQLWLTTWCAVAHGDEWEPIVVPRMYWAMLKNPALSPDDAFNLIDAQDGRASRR